MTENQHKKLLTLVDLLFQKQGDPLFLQYCYQLIKVFAEFMEEEGFKRGKNSD